MNEQLDHRDSRANFDPLDDVLRTYPLAPVPPTLAAGILGRLRDLPASVRPRFRLNWFDYAIGLFTTGMAGIGYLLWQSIPPPLMARLQIEWILLLQRLAQFATHLPALVN